MCSIEEYWKLHFDLGVEADQCGIGWFFRPDGLVRFYGTSLLSLIASARKLCNSWNGILCAWVMIVRWSVKEGCYASAINPPIILWHLTLLSCNALQCKSLVKVQQLHNAVRFVICAKMPYNAINVFCAVPSVFITVDRWEHRLLHKYSSIQFVEEWNEKKTELWDNLQRIDRPYSNVWWT